jgi:hypothetical protein
MVFSYLWPQENHLQAELATRMGHPQAPELRLLAFTPEQAHLLRWEHDREFEYQGQMYDIVRTYQHHDTTYFECWPDHEETRLKRKMNSLLVNETNGAPFPSENEKRLFDFFKSLVSPHAAMMWNTADNLTSILPDKPVYYYSNHYCRPPSPPPK